MILAHVLDEILNRDLDEGNYGEIFSTFDTQSGRRYEYDGPKSQKDSTPK